MADVKISQLPAASTPLAGTEQIPLVQDSTTKQITVSNLLTSANLGTPSAINLANATNVPMDEASGTLAVANGGTGTATPALVAGTNVTISGSWPNQTINSTYSGAVTSVTGTAPVVSSGGTTPAISMAAATGSVNGYLTSTDWTTFNNKLTSGGALGTPSSGTATNLTGLPLSTGVTGLLPVANGGTGTATPALVAGSNVTISGTWPNQTIAAAGAAQVYPGAGIANSTGSAWGTSYTTTGSGTVLALATSPTFVTPALGTPASGDFSTGTFTWPTFNQNTSGTAAGLSATLAVASGGTGQTSYTDGQLLIGNSTGNTLTKATLTAGANITITNSAGGITIAAAGGGGSGTVTSVSGTGTVNGLTLTGTVTTSGSLTLGGTLDLSSPPAIGGTTAAAITGTVVTATTKVVTPYVDAVGSGGGQLRNASGTSQLAWGAGGGSNLTLEVATNINPANAAVSIAPTGTGTVTINPATAGTINNMSIGTSTAAAGAFTTLSASSTVTLSGGTANGVAYLNGSKVLTSGSALTFDGNLLSNLGSADRARFGTATRSIYIAGDSSGVSLFDGAAQTGNGWYINGASSYIAGYIGSAEQMRLTSTGLGIGTSSPASYGGFKTLTLNGSTGGLIQLQSNGTNTGRFYAPSASNTVIDTLAGDLTVYATGSLFLGTGNATKATLDTSGNLGLGVTPSAWVTNGKAIQFSSYGSVLATNSGDVHIINNAYLNSGASAWIYTNTGTASQYYQYQGQHVWRTAASGTANTTISFNQYMTLDANGNLLVGTTSQSGKLAVSGNATSAALVTFYSSTAGDVGQAGLLIGKIDNNTTTSQVILRATILSTGAGAGQINMNGANSLAFGTYSDQRLKENIVDLDPQLANILALRPVEFDYIASEGGGHQTGFIAQEIQQIYSDAVGEREDGMLTVSGWSKTEARLVKAIQEQQALIQSLKARLDAANL